jgi:hypothetical protein
MNTRKDFFWHRLGAFLLCQNACRRESSSLASFGCSFLCRNACRRESNPLASFVYCITLSQKTQAIKLHCLESFGLRCKFSLSECMQTRQQMIGIVWVQFSLPDLHALRRECSSLASFGCIFLCHYACRRENMLLRTSGCAAFLCQYALTRTQLLASFEWIFLSQNACRREAHFIGIVFVQISSFRVH